MSTVQGDAPSSALLNDIASIAPQELLQRFRGPGRLLTQDGAVLAKNDVGDELIRLMGATPGRPLGLTLYEVKRSGRGTWKLASEDGRPFDTQAAAANIVADANGRLSEGTS